MHVNGIETKIIARLPSGWVLMKHVCTYGTTYRWHLEYRDTARLGL